MTVTVINCSMGAFAGFLANLMSRMGSGPGELPAGEIFIVDKTGLPGKYSFQFELDPDLFGIQAALQSKLGLRLVERKIAREHIVVDHIDKMPTEN
ncbi:MAG TPA: TIGR03435 family protein [Bryobacteraceae bacterium]|nr:TIGR03435 family protein [Bryobacteraceae bacterium]